MRRLLLAVWVLAVAGVLAHAAPKPKPAPVAVVVPPPRALPRELPGWAHYDRLCLPCHGAAGDGRGPAAPWLWPRPRALTGGTYKWRSTDVGATALDDDLAATIRFGVPGTSMPGFGDTLGDDDVAALITVVRAFEVEPLAQPQGRTVGAPPTSIDASRGAALWTSAGCASCHGATGAGDGPAALALVDAQGRAAPPFDLALGARRPRAADDDAALLAATYASIDTGLSGTAMPGYHGVLSSDEVWQVAAYVAAMRPELRKISHGPGPVPPEAIAADRADRLTRGGWWPGVPDAAGAAEAHVFGGTIARQGDAPAALAPAAASLSSRQCARCHAKQVREWTGSIHAAAASPGLLAQVARLTDGAKVESCMRCHAPLAEQQPVTRPAQERAGAAETGADARTYRASPFLDDELRDEGLTCAACHLRGWTRHGPTAVADSLLPLDGYPTAPLALYERSDFCLPCHQLEPRAAIDGRPLLDTYREWLAGPYMRRGVQCQHCHMPNREHTFKGIHDPDTFRQGIAVAAITRRGATGVVSVRARIRNVGAGHYLPTTPTPAVWLRVELVDDRGLAIAGAAAEQRIGRQLRQRAGAWEIVEDTRIPPGETREVAGAWQRGRVAEATAVRVTVEVHPDDYYEGLHAARLKARGLSDEVRAGFAEALERARSSYYVAYDETFAIE